jgi:hypothetical protein
MVQVRQGFHCPKCQLHFDTIAQYKRHKHCPERGNAPGEWGMRCGKGFRNAQSLKEHIERVHHKKVGVGGDGAMVF